jgi:hypothetical protein
MTRYVLGYRVEDDDEGEAERIREAREERAWQKGWDSVPLGGFEAYEAKKEEEAR